MSAPTCHGCGKVARKLYGGMGRYFVYCLACWSTDRPERDLEAGAAGGVRGAEE